MVPREWTRSDVEALVAGRTVRVLTPAYQDLEVPEWLLGAAEGRGPLSAAEAMAQVHDDDVGELVQWFVTCLEAPGADAGGTVRARLDDRWHRVTFTLVNLTEDAALGGVLVVTDVEALDEAFDDGHEVDRVGDSSSAPWMLCTLDAAGVVRHVEGRARELTGRDDDDILGRRVIELLDDVSMRDSAPIWLAMQREGYGATRTTRRYFLHPAGGGTWAEATYLSRLRPDGTGDVLMLACDITERRAQEDELRRSNEEIRRLADESTLLAEHSRMMAEDFRMLADEVPMAVFRCEPDGTLTFNNIRWREMFEGRDPIEEVQAIVDPDDRGLVDELFRTILAEGVDESRTVEVRARHGERVLAVRARPVSDLDGAHQRLVGSVADITSTVKLRQEARQDPLTGLLNRAALESCLAEALERRADGTVVVFVDLDGFKGVNDVHGHDAGDVVLAEVAARLSGALRPDDAVGRYGGDEFVMVCRDARPQAARGIVQRLELALGLPIEFPGGSWQPSASIGAVVPEPGEELASVLRRADLAMFEVKRDRHASREHIGR